MSTLSILRNSLKQNADVITMLQNAIIEANYHGREYEAEGEIAYSVTEFTKARKLKVKLATAVAMQKRIKVEIAAIFRQARVTRKFVAVFGFAPHQPLTTSVEQEAMLDTLLAEKAEAAKEAEPKQATVAE